jgi:hypothetical protein
MVSIFLYSPHRTQLLSHWKPASDATCRESRSAQESDKRTTMYYENLSVDSPYQPQVNRVSCTRNLSISMRRGNQHLASHYFSCLLNGPVGSNVLAIRSFEHIKQTTSNVNSGFGISATQCVDSVTRISFIAKGCITLRWEGITVRRASKKTTSCLLHTQILV